MYIFEGAATALITPFDKKNKINFDSFKKIIDHQLANKISALVFLGTTGEASTLSEKEKLEVAEFAVSYVKHKVPVILGAGGNNTYEVIKRSKKFAKLGADALLQVSPYYNKATQNGLVEHYSLIANKSKVPQILYNVPSRTGVNLMPETVSTLSKNPNIIGIKEAGGNISQLNKLMSQKPKDFAVYSGDDENIFTTLALGGQGVISVVSNILPKETQSVCQLYFDGKIQEARNIQFELLPIIEMLFCEVNPIPVKSAMNLLGFNAGVPRLPLTKFSEENLKKLKNKLNLC
ncbi:MAG: 4-hydroxy-tetrahydrodipicolinate synthase [Clostridia bacterium]|nr:4-hydroxy-tetrahydrodipicolinate synthase [Clostridia bacterium]